MVEINTTCKNLYSFIRLRIGTVISDREIARRWPMEWKSFNGLKHGKRQVPRIADLEGLARLLGIDPAFVFEVARGVSAALVHELLQEKDTTRLSHFLMPIIHAGNAATTVSTGVSDVDVTAVGVGSVGLGNAAERSHRLSSSGNAQA